VTTTYTQATHLPTDPGHGYALARTDAATSFEDGQPVPAPAADDDPLRVEVAGGPTSLPAGRPGVGLTGLRALRVTAAAGIGRARRVLLADLDVAVEPATELRYAVCPVLDDTQTYASTSIAVEALLDDGTWSGDLGLPDRYGMPASARGQGEARILLPDHWNLVRVDLGAHAGRRVRALAVTVDAPAGSGATEAWLDDVALGLRAEPVRRGLVDHVDTRRGTHSSGSYSRGNTIPATAVPNGFTFWTPLTDGASDRWLYSWAGHNGPDNRPRLHGVAISHQPSPWMGDRDQLAFHPVPAGSDASVDASLDARALGFVHDDEVARPHRYGVALDGDVRVDVTPTDHGGVLRFAFAPGTAVGHVLVDVVSTAGAGPDGPAALTVAADGTLTGWVDTGSRLSVGRSRMYVVGRFSRPVTAGTVDGDRPHAAAATVALGDDPVVELRVATSFIGTEQAWHTFGLELADRSFAAVEADARARWEARLAVLEVEGATEEQLATLYGGLYRLNLYPSSQWENAGTAERPDPWHASPVAPPTGPSTASRTGAAVLPGRVHVNHGFWDTYRTCWSAYALLYPDVAAELADGFVQQYREGGWIARWSSPGYADLMTGTSSDVAFADLHARGVGLPDPLATYDAALRNATALPDAAGVGRKGQAHALLRGYVPRDVEESVSWHLEASINDAGLAAMARALADAPGTPDARRRALADEAAYLAQRAGGYVHLFDAGSGFFRARTRSGSFGSEDFDPRDWGGDYTESDAWNFAFHAPHDPAGLAALHGGPAGLAAVLERFFATPERADRPGGYGSAIHEMAEARDVRLGQLGQSNQVSHHIPYTWLAAGRPDRTQEVVREVLDRLWTGSELGQGYHGDEDNGEMSAWYVLSALGLYPLQVGSDRWAVGTPLFERAVVHHPAGDLVVEASGAGPYVRGLTVGGREVTEPVLRHAELLGGVTVAFDLSTEPAAWGRDVTRGDVPAPAPVPWRDVTSGGSWHGGGGAVPGLSDDDLASGVDLAGALAGGAALTWSGGGDGEGGVLVAYTLTSAADGAPAPGAWRLEARGADGSWRCVDERAGEAFAWAGQLRPFVLDAPVVLGAVRLVVAEPRGVLAQVELLVDPALG
jgi:predicted alpha-1,2-mannosidase